MQRHTVYFIWKLLYMFWVVPSPIIRSANNYLQHLAFVTPLLLSAAIVEKSELVWVCYSTLKPVPPLPLWILPPLVFPLPVIQYIFLHCLYLSTALYLQKKKPLFLHKNNTVKFISNTEFCLFVCLQDHNCATFHFPVS